MRRIIILSAILALAACKKDGANTSSALPPASGSGAARLRPSRL